MAYLAAVNSSAMTIFIRNKGNVPQLDFRKLASLYTVQLFTSNLQATLVSCSTSGSKVIWKQYCGDNLNLILVTSDVVCSDTQLRYLLDLVFNSMVLMVGLHLLETDAANTEKLKRELKCAHPLIDLIFQGDHTLMSPYTGLVDTMATENTASLSGALESFIVVAKSSYGCLTAHGRVCVATESWWGLSPMETSLLSLLLSSLPPASCYDIPVYLPRASSKIAHRLVIFTLYEGVCVSILCNPEPPLSALQELVHAHWMSQSPALQTLASSFPRCLQGDVSVDPAVLAFCLVNTSNGRSLTSLRPSGDQGNSAAALTAGYHGEMKLERRLANLTKFYKTVVGELFPSQTSSDLDGGAGDLTVSPLCAKIPHKILDTYICCKKHKGYAVQRDRYHLFAIFSAATPTFTLKKYATNLLETLTKSKSKS